uniref:Uncharacterized protein n=1 Tax=Anguilla anguilla TaxID=7936 RepID=A0A0E9QUD0_ANGAN
MLWHIAGLPIKKRDHQSGTQILLGTAAARSQTQIYSR